MNARLVFCLAMGVFTTFLGFSMLLKGCNAATRTGGRSRRIFLPPVKLLK